MKGQSAMIALAKKTGNSAYLRAAAQLQRAGDVPDAADTSRSLLDLVGPRQGRPELEDLGPLLFMALLLARDPERSELSAAQEVAHAIPRQHSLESTVERLRKKFRKHRQQLLDLARQFSELQRAGAAVAKLGVAIMQTAAQTQKVTSTWARIFASWTKGSAS
jgi:hypothetical protein